LGSSCLHASQLPNSALHNGSQIICKKICGENMIVVWTIVAYVLSLIATNLTWLLLPVVFLLLRIRADPEEWASGKLVSYKIVNFAVGNAAGFWSIAAPSWFLKYVEVSSSIPVLVIGALLVVSLMPKAMRHITPYSKYGIYGEAFGLTLALVGVFVGK
jgi:hypothetical protein